MKAASIIGSMVVTIALVFYSTGYINEKRKQLVTSQVLFFYSVGVALDISATTFMIIGSSRGLVTLHGFIGYSSLLGMLTDTFLLWRHYLKEGPEKMSGAHFNFIQGLLIHGGLLHILLVDCW